MPEPTRCPGLPPADYPDLLVRAGRRRRVRRRNALLAAGPFAVLAVAVAVSSPNAGGGALLQVDNPAAGPAAHSPEPPPKPSESPLVPVPLPTVSPPPKVPELTPASPKPTTSPDEQPTPKPTEPDAPATYAYVTGVAPSGCASALQPKSPDSANWCQHYSGPASVVSGSNDVVVWDLCRASTAGSGTLTHSGPVNWLKTAVHSPKTEQSWHWVGEAPPNAETLTVGAGDCARWTIPFHVIQEYTGDPLAPGTYEIAVGFFVDEYVSSHDTVSITVTSS